MLTKKQNLLETIRGGKPDRYVNQYEYMHMIMGTPFTARNQRANPGQTGVKDLWGITWSWPEGTPGQFPVHTPDKIAIPDIEELDKYYHEPSLDFTDEDWAPFLGQLEGINRDEEFVTVFVAPGIFEMCHHLQEIQNCLMNFYEYPDEMHDLIDRLTNWELRYAEQICKYLKPDAIFHHDDWGSQQSTFISPEMWREFIKPAYEKIYGYYKAHGVELIVHHSDSFAATLVPDMIDVGIDVWQGVMTSNNIPELIEKYGGKITFMGGIDSATVDRPDWTPELVAQEVRKVCEAYGTKYFIPNTTQGLGMSTFPGVYEAVSAEIDKMSKEMF